MTDTTHCHCIVSASLDTRVETYSYKEKRRGKESLRTGRKKRKENDWSLALSKDAISALFKPGSDSGSSVTEKSCTYCSWEGLLQLCWECSQSCAQTLPDFFLITAGTISIQICHSAPCTKAVLPPRDYYKRCSALRPCLQPRLLSLHGMNRNWKPAPSPPKQSVVKKKSGEHVLTDSSLTNSNSPASCLLRNVVKCEYK